MESETQVLHANAADGISRPSSTPTPESTSLAHQPFPNLASLATSTASGTTTTPLVSRDVLMHQPPPAVHMEGSPAATSGGPGGMVSFYLFFTSDTFYSRLYLSCRILAIKTPIPFIAIAFPRARKLSPLPGQSALSKWRLLMAFSVDTAQSRAPLPTRSRARPRTN